MEKTFGVTDTFACTHNTYIIIAISTYAVFLLYASVFSVCRYFNVFVWVTLYWALSCIRRKITVA